MKPTTVQGLAKAIYEDNYDHFDFMDNMNGGDCDCYLCGAMNIIALYGDFDVTDKEWD